MPHVLPRREVAILREEVFLHVIEQTAGGRGVAAPQERPTAIV
jgi:hypothetical protein